MKNLFQLIQDLRPSEKKHFRLFAKIQQNKKNDVVKLFDILNDITTFNATIVLNKFNKNRKIKVKKLGPVKRGLQKLLFRSLKDAHTDSKYKTKRLELYDLMYYVEILLEKDLHKPALDLVNKGMKTAEQYQFFLLYLDLSLIHRRINFRFKVNNVAHHIRVSQVAFKNNLSLIYQEADLLTICEELFLILRYQNLSITEVGVRFNQWQSFLEKLQIQDLTFNGATYYHRIYSIYYYLLKDYKKSKDHAKKVPKLYIHYSFPLNEFQGRYIRSVNNYLNKCIRLKDYKDVWEGIELLELIKPKNKRIEILLFHQIHYFKQMYYFLNYQYETAIKLVPNIEKGLNNFKYNIPFDRHFALIYNITISYFMVKDFDKALKYLDVILSQQENPFFNRQTKKIELKIEDQITARVLEICIRYEEKEYKYLLSSLIPRAYRFIRKNNKQRGIEYSIVRAIEKAILKQKESEFIFRHLLITIEDNSRYAEFRRWLISIVGEHKKPWGI